MVHYCNEDTLYLFHFLPPFPQTKDSYGQQLTQTPFPSSQQGLPRVYVVAYVKILCPILLCLTESVNLEFPPKGLTANAIYPDWLRSWFSIH